MRAERTAIQLAAEELLDSDGIHLAMERLGRSPLVSVERLGHSREGHAIEALIVTSEKNQGRLDRVRAAAARLSLGEGPGEEDAEEHLPLPILMTASNYGSEAAQTEALLELVGELTSAAPLDVDVLDRLVIILLPCLNPDGRENALRIWRRTHLASAMSAFGNAFGIQVAREYLHLLEPETIALAELVRRWHPALVWEVHEDAIGLGRMLDETCLAPPMAPRAESGRWVASRPGELHHELWEQEARYGALIAEEWSARGFALLHSATGEHGWPVPIVEGYGSLAQHPETRFTRAMALRGVTTFITESARTPGSQTWRERVDQKVSAGLAIARAAADDRPRLVRIVRESTRAAMAVETEVYVIPARQDVITVEHAVDVLAMHEVEVKEVGSNFVVSRAQARGATAEVLLDFERSRHQSFVASIGLRVIPSRTMDPPERRYWENVRGKPVAQRITKARPIRSGRTSGATIVVYAGQGVADYAAEGHLGGVERLLSGAGVAYETVDSEDIKRGALNMADVLIVPKGDMVAIRDGNGPNSFWHAPPWEPETPGAPLPAETVTSFVRDGGRYIGLDVGGGSLALALGLIDCEVRSMNAGTGLVELKLTESGLAGLGPAGSWDALGQWRTGIVPAIMACEAQLGENGGLVLGIGSRAQCLARYSAFLPVEGVPHITELQPTDDAADWGAIACGQYGDGDVYVFGIDPTYRSLSEPAALLLLRALSATTPSRS